MKSNSDKKPKNYTVIHIIVMILAGILVGVFIRDTVFAAQNYYTNTHANFVQEYATIVRYEEMYAQNGRRTYSTFYEYENDGGVYYGLWKRLIKNEEEAKAQVGKKVPIYVDHAKKIHSTTLEFNSSAIWFASVLLLISITIFTNSFVREIIYIVRLKKYKKASGTKKD